MSLLEIPTLQHTSTVKKQEQYLHDSSVAVMLREMQREVNAGHPFVGQAVSRNGLRTFRHMQQRTPRNVRAYHDHSNHVVCVPHCNVVQVQVRRKTRVHKDRRTINRRLTMPTISQRGQDQLYIFSILQF